MSFLKRNKVDKKFSSLNSIEERLLEIEEEKPRRIHNLEENFTGDIMDHLDEEFEIRYLDIEKSQLLLKRQFLLDKRGDWKRKILWDVFVPIVVASITTYIVTNLIS